MSDADQIRISITGGGAAPDGLASEIENMEGARAMITDRSNLSGSASEWMMIASIGATLLPHIVDLLKTYMSNRAPDQDVELEFAGMKVKNPPPEVIEEMLRKSRAGD